MSDQNNSNQDNSNNKDKPKIEKKIDGWSKGAGLVEKAVNIQNGLGQIKNG